VDTANNGIKGLTIDDKISAVSKIIDKQKQSKIAIAFRDLNSVKLTFTGSNIPVSTGTLFVYNFQNAANVTAFVLFDFDYFVAIVGASRVVFVQI
jgi:hypothetical protein